VEAIEALIGATAIASADLSLLAIRGRSARRR
jgi:hypothetical protein